MVKICEGCKHHAVHYDGLQHDGCYCQLEREEEYAHVDDEDLDHDESCVFDRKCKYREGE